MLKPSDIAQVGLDTTEQELRTAAGPEYIDFLRETACEWQRIRTAALVIEREAAKVEAAAGFRNMAITIGYPDRLCVGDLPAARFLIEWLQPRWNSDSETMDWLPMRAHGFDAVPQDVTRFMLAHAPDLLPPEIAELAPDNPEAALATYLRRYGPALN